MINSNKVALVTGASRGIGFAVAKELASLGYSLALISRSQKEIQHASEEIRKIHNNIKIITSSVDVTKSGEPEKFIDKVNTELGNISVLVNNAGYYTKGTSEISDDDQNKLFDTNYFAPARLVKAVLPSMKKNGNGYIFNIASLCGIEAFPDVGVYSASKFALVGYSSALAQELAPLGIKVTAICPSWVNTQIASDSSISPEEMIQPSDIGLTIRYLLELSPSALVREIVIRC